METKERVLSRAGELIPFMGVKNLTMDAIATDLGISKRTIYELFRDKDDLVLQSFEYMILESNKKLLKIVEQTENVIEALFVIIEQQHRQMLTLNPVFLEDMKKYFLRLNARFYADCKINNKFSVSYALLEKGIREKIFRSNLKIDVVDNFLHELINMFHNNEGIRLMNLNKQDALDNIMLPYFRGISTAKGLLLIDAYFKENNPS
jgi:TetR/AcrR family transcriptional regulator, cholesterol catabolism regulator